ncbi:rab-GTPase-TBC domain-containing protein [Cunninghamella echinulata]|nr:rab-GTPase-TBC domain-containing protein [Cunninghamella echinulata]
MDLLNGVATILSRKHNHPSDSENSLMDLRISILSNTCPQEYRGLLWKLFLRLNDISANSYITLVERGASSMDDKIRNDTFRTLTTDNDFLEQVSEDMLIRVLNAFVWLNEPEYKVENDSTSNQDNDNDNSNNHDIGSTNNSDIGSNNESYENNNPDYGNNAYHAKEDNNKNNGTTNELIQLRKRCSTEWFPNGKLTYVQGMNVLLAPFLMVLSEMESFFAFTKFMWKWCPLYVLPSLKGVHCGVKLVDLCLQHLDPQLYYSLLSKGLTANMYAVPSVMTLCACTPPLNNLLPLWDVMFAFGIHLNLLFIIAQLALIRNDLITNPSPIKLLRKLPMLQPEKIIKITLSSIKILPADLYDKMVRHAYDETVADSLGIQISAGISQSNDMMKLPAYIADL